MGRREIKVTVDPDIRTTLERMQIYPKRKRKSLITDAMLKRGIANARERRKLMREIEQTLKGLERLLSERALQILATVHRELANP